MPVYYTTTGSGVVTQGGFYVPKSVLGTDNLTIGWSIDVSIQESNVKFIIEAISDSPIDKDYIYLYARANKYDGLVWSNLIVINPDIVVDSGNSNMIMTSMANYNATSNATYDGYVANATSIAKYNATSKATYNATSKATYDAQVAANVKFNTSSTPSTTPMLTTTSIAKSILPTNITSVNIYIIITIIILLGIIGYVILHNKK